MGKPHSQAHVVKKAERALDRADETSATQRHCKPFGRNCGSACQALLVLLFGLLLGALLILTNGAFFSGGIQNAGEQSALALACWSLILIGIAGTVLAGHGVSWGWLILFGLQPVWIAYAIITGQHGFIAGALAYGIAQLHGFVRSNASPRGTAPCKDDSESLVPKTESLGGKP